MFCRNCGKEVNDNAVICPHCGIQLAQIKSEEKKQETNTMAIVGFILSFFISIAGLICSIIGYKKCRDENLNGKGFAIAGIIISAVSIVITVIYIIVAVALVASVL